MHTRKLCEACHGRGWIAPKKGLSRMCKRCNGYGNVRDREIGHVKQCEHRKGTPEQCQKFTGPGNSYCSAHTQTPAPLEVTCAGEYRSHAWEYAPPPVAGPAVIDLTPKRSSYEITALEIGKLVTEKQIAYGDSFGKAGSVMRILYPEGIPLEKLDDALTVIRILDKLFRIATDRDALGESPWRDIAGYSILAAGRASK